MPFFEPDEARRMLGDASQAEEVADLRGLSRREALRRLDAVIGKPATGSPRSIVVRIDSPAEAGGETLFRPVGQHLLKAKRRKLIDRVLPVQQEGGGGGFVIERRVAASRPKTG